MHLPELAKNYKNDTGAQAAHRLFSLCFQHHGGSTIPIAEFLVGLYNSAYARPAPYLLCRRISDKHFEDVLIVMRWFQGEFRHEEIHNIFGAQGDHVMSELMESFELGPCRAKNNPEIDE